MKAEIFGIGPGLARIRLTGIALPAEGCSLQLQRNQSPDSYLGLTGRWQASPECWHPLNTGDLEALPDGVEFEVGPQIVDPIVSVMAQNAFRLNLRSAAGPMAAILVLSNQHALFASSARHTEPEEAPPPPPPSRPAEIQKPVEPLIQPPIQPIVSPLPELKVVPADQLHNVVSLDGRDAVTNRSRKGLLMACAAMIVLAAAGGAAFLYLRPGTAPNTASQSAGSAPQSTREALQSFMKDSPDLAAIVAKADQMKVDGNTDGAVYLYRQGADRGDAHSAMELGILYDPAERAPASSGLSKSSDTAAYWYGKAADAGLVEAQRRLGILLTKDHAAGSSEFASGIAQLQAASKQGDAEAAAKLKELGQ